MKSATLLLMLFTGALGAEPVHIGERVNARIENGVAITEGVIRVRRRHENDMDFAKYNPFYWEGRLSTFKVEDFTPTGEKKIRFSLFTEWPQDYTKYRGVDFSCIYTGKPLAHETERSKFAINARMKHVKDFRHFEFELGEIPFHQFPEQLKAGSFLTFEFRFFNNEQHPGWARQKQRNPHNLSAYYSEFFRVVIGKPGLWIDDFTPANAKPSPRRYTGGWTTVPTARVEPWSALQQQAFNLSTKNAQAFLNGRTWFHTDFKTGRHLSDRSDDKPSVFFEDMQAERKGYAASAYNVTSCNACHLHNGRAPLEQTVLRTRQSDGSPHPVFGVQLQTDGPDREGTVGIVRKERELTYQIDGKTIPHSPRHPPALIGMGLLDAVPESLLDAIAQHNGGRRRGRFGWKAEQPNLRAQVQDALLHDMGVMSKGKESVDGKATPGKGLLPESAIDELEAYVALLGVPPRNRPEDPQVLRGEQVFRKLKCHHCHAHTLRTGGSKFTELREQVIHPYTDLLLHDLGPGLADSGPAEFVRLWRTAPLWGLKNTRDAANDFTKTFRPGDTEITYEQTMAAAKENPVRLLHDGRARSIDEAIGWHGGEAEAAAKGYQALGQEEQEALKAFLWDL